MAVFLNNEAANSMQTVNTGRDRETNRKTNKKSAKANITGYVQLEQHDKQVGLSRQAPAAGWLTSSRQPQGRSRSQGQWSLTESRQYCSSMLTGWVCSCAPAGHAAPVNTHSQRTFYLFMPNSHRLTWCDEQFKQLVIYWIIPCQPVAVSGVRHITAGLIYYQIFCCSALANKEENIDYGHVWACPSITPPKKCSFSWDGELGPTW